MDRKKQMVVLTDTEAETSIELDTSMQQLNLNEATNQTKSVFNITLDQFSEESESVKLDDQGYEERLQREIKDWNQLWRNALKHLERLKNEPHPTVDSSLLSSDKRAYLQAAPCLQKFIRDSIEFRVSANIFLKKDCEEIEEMEQNLIDVCEQRVTMFKEGIFLSSCNIRPRPFQTKRNV